MQPKVKIILAVVIGVLVVVASATAFFTLAPVSTNLDAKASSSLTRVACLGDSITQITGYPYDLQTLLGNISQVMNFGVSGSTVTFNSDTPYYYQPAYRQAENFQPTTVIIMLGTNDAHEVDFKQVNTFITDYKKIIAGMQTLYSDPQIFLVEPPPVFNNTLGIDGTYFAQRIIPLIQQVASQLKLPLINVYTPLLGQSQYFPDGVHPNSAGAKEISEIIYRAITNTTQT